ncbi:MAG TPA: DUF3568 family protein [Burkholderiales bacterium]|nr:DUF3568 family protein [Burkholderiales bacterium]
MRCIFVALLAMLLSGCDPVSLTVFGVGTAAGVQHTLTGIAYKTFTVPLPRMRTAVNQALNQMDIKIGATEKMSNAKGERIKARAADRDIEIELEALTSRTTRMRSIARSGLLLDSATATEIILQTEKALGAT